MARVGGETSLRLKLMRRMRVTSLSASGGKVTVKGRVVKPLARRKKDRTIVLQRFVSCSQAETVARFKPRRSGAFSVTVDAPAGRSGATRSGRGPS